MPVHPTAILLFVVLLSPLFHLHAANHAVSDGDSIIVYGDGLFEDIVKAAVKELREDLKKRRIDIDSEDKKKGMLATINEDLADDVIDEEPNLVVIAFGLYDVCDPKKEKAREDYDLDAIKSELISAVKALQAANIKVVLVTPGLAGEDLNNPVQTDIDKVAEVIRQVAAELDTGLCDVRAAVVEWLKNNPPEKSGRTQLTRRGVKWDDLGEELLAPQFMAALGLSASGIKRAITFDERVLFATSMGTWTVKIDKELTKALAATEPKKPKEFFNPGIKGPVAVDLAVGDIYTDPLDIDLITKQKPSVVFVSVLSKWCRNTHYDRRNVDANLDAMMQAFSQLEFPLWVFTPLWMNEDGQKNLTGKDGPRYARCREAAELIKQSAAKHGVAVIDVFSMCEQAYQQDQSKVFYGLYEADPKQLILADDGRALLFKEMKRALGLLAADE